ncbi:MFS general substrate transporter [Hyaloscypha variabilis F]|uniref:MFS general substrate transporter n=1 Tax=Hyaloscypha variabilis (strain UAMH 11265 / GT02V1 / F) TaxID=1149755 RepID=A0A2J6QXX4_HYAVF|nr:MFS general substrate transporter [Hyaloscypha variabilis F]
MSDETAESQTQVGNNEKSPNDWPKNIVDWDGPDDPKNPMNWSRKKKLGIAVLLGLITMGSSFASSSFSPTFDAVSMEFGVSTEAFAPISELYGRKISILPAYLIFDIFLIGVATAENIQTIMLCQFFAGLFASAPLSNAAGAMANLWNDHDRALAVVGYSVAVIGGPTVGPLIGSAITNSYLGWRWTEYITAIIIFSILFLDIFLLPETYAPVLLQRKANHLRYTTRNWALHAPADAEELTLQNIIEKHLALPLLMLTSEPIIFCLALYNAFVYGLLYLLFEAFPIEYEEHRHWTAVQGSLVFLAVLIGVLVSGCIQASYQPYFWKQLDKAHALGKRNNPEARLPPMMLGSMLFAAGLFMFGGGSGVEKSAATGIVGAGLIGAGFILIFQNAVNYLIDAFTIHAASAQAANTFLRSLAGAGFPLFATPMFHKLGVNWASYLLGFVAVALIPIPVLFYVFGKELRGMSRYNQDKATQNNVEKIESRVLRRVLSRQESHYHV